MQWFFRPDAPGGNFTCGVKEYGLGELLPDAPRHGPQVSFDVAREDLTGRAGPAFVARLIRFLDPGDLLRRKVRVKRRRRGCSDEQNLLALILSFRGGGGHLGDVDDLGADSAACRLAGAVPGRRLGEFLARMSDKPLAGLQECARLVSRRLVPQVARHSLETPGYVPVFVDGSGIEVSGRHG